MAKYLAKLTRIRFWSQQRLPTCVVLNARKMPKNPADMMITFMV